MLRSRLASVALSCCAISACARPAYEATPEGRVLAEWTAPPPTRASGTNVTGELTTPKGARYRVEAAMGEAGGNQLPVTVRIELVANPSRAHVEVRCGDPMHFATDPPNQYSAVCEASERSGTESLLGTSTHQDRHVLRVVGDGRVLLEGDGGPP